MKKSLIKKPSLLINAISNYASLITHIIIGFLLTPFIINQLGKTGYGIWTFIGAFFGYYGLINLGVDSAISRYVALYVGQDDKESLNRTASTAMSMFCFTGIIAVAISFILANPIARFFEVSPELFDEFKYMVWIMGITTGLSFPSGVFETIVQAHERYVPINYVKIIRDIVRAGLIVCLLLLGRGLVGIAFALLGSQLFALIANYLIFKYFTHQVRIRLTYACWPFLKKLLIFGGITTVITIADYLRMNLDSFVIGKFVGMIEVGVYGIAMKIIGYMLSLIIASMSVITPRFAALYGFNDHERIKDILLKSLRISAFLSFGCCMGAIILGRHFIILWVGKDFIESISILWILSVSFAFALSQNPGIGLMYALNKHYFYAIATIIEAIANLILSILLVTKYGIIGVALGTAIPMLIVKIIAQPVYVSKIINITILDYAKCIIPYCILCFIIVVLSYRIGIITHEPVTIPYFLSVGIIISFVYCSASFLSINKKDQKIILSRIFKTVQQ